MPATQATKEKMSPVFSLAASAAAAPAAARMRFCTNEPTEPETRIRGFNSETTAYVSPTTWLSSTWQPAYRLACGELAVVQLVQRYYTSVLGRFMTPDPARSSTGPGDPGSWNRYSYTRADPINRSDPTGLDDCPAGDCVLTGNSDGYPNPSAVVVSWAGWAGFNNNSFRALGALFQMEVKNHSNAMRQQASQAVANLGPGCTSVFSSMNIQITNDPMITGNSEVTVLQALQITAGDTNFFDAFGKEGTLRLSQTGLVDPVTGQPYQGDQTIQSYVPSWAAAVSPGEGIIYLAASFYSGTQQWQSDALVHELLHGVFGGASDATLDTLFGISLPSGLTGDTLAQAASGALQSWIQSDCGKNK